MRIALLGAGDVAGRHIDGLLRAGDVHLITVFDPVAERAQALADQFGFERVDEDPARVVAADDVDLVLVLTPHDLHAPQAIAAMEAGKDVFCEKPMARTVAECDAMLAAMARTGRTLLVTHALRAMLTFVHARERMAAEALGRVTLAAFTWFTDELPRLNQPNHWKGTIDRSGGAVLIDGGCHMADIGNSLFGRACRVQAFGDRQVSTREGVGEDTVVFQVEYASGTLASYALSFVAGSGLRPQHFACGADMQLFGLEGHIEGGYRFRDDERREYWREHHTGAEDESHEELSRDTCGVDTMLVQALRGECEAPVTAVDARNAVAVVEAAYRSIESAATVTVDWREE